MNHYPSIILKKGKDQSLRRFHPWVFSGAIERMDQDIKNGQLVSVFSKDGNFLGTGFYHQGSISVRIISFQDQIIDVDFWIRMLQKALALRKRIFERKSLPLNVYRLFHAEGDGVPGLMMDVYDNTIVIQTHTSGIYQQLSQIVSAVEQMNELCRKAILLKKADTTENGQKNVVLKGSPENIVTVDEYGHLFKVDIFHGQKTGFFIDQRENRLLLSNYVNGKDVLNAFSYTGGFSVYALRAGAESVCSVDSSEAANLLCEENIRLNKLDETRHQIITADVKDFIKEIDNKYDVIVLDPPAFAKHIHEKHQATIGYKRLNAEAFRKIKKGGMLFTFSCSQAVDRALFEHTVRAAAIESGRKIQILHHPGQPPDHPVSIYHPEGEYLKGLVCLVD